MCGATYAAATGVVKEWRAEAVGRARHRALSASSGPSSRRIGAVVGSVQVSTCETRNWQRCHLRRREGSDNWQAFYYHSEKRAERS
jgi:hypothetical protein